MVTPLVCRSDESPKLTSASPNLALDRSSLQHYARSQSKANPSRFTCGNLRKRNLAQTFEKVHEIASVQCHLCKSPAESVWQPAEAAQILEKCTRCGDFRITTEAAALLQTDPLTLAQSANVSGYLRHNPGFAITTKDLPTLKALRAPTVPEKALSALLVLAKDFPEPGSQILLYHDILDGELLQAAAQDHDKDGKLVLGDVKEGLVSTLSVMGYCSAQSQQELCFLLDEYLKAEGWTVGHPYGGFQISPRGWEVVAENQRGLVQSNKAFVAMSFDPSLGDLYRDGLSVGILAAGYEPVRMDRVQHNNRIDDEIIARIRGCKFLVADFSINRGGIYFEAGFALGLNRPVIWTCRDGALHDVHFDTRQYNFIKWQQDKLPDLANALKNRIEATIGKGDYRQGAN